MALRAAEIGWKVAGYDPDAQQARALGAALAARSSSLGELAEASDVLVLAGPVGAILAGLAELTAAPPPASLIIDVASVKAGIAVAGAGLGAFVPTHPMAGSERRGARAARSDLFAHRAWSYDPAAACAAAAERFIATMGARPLPVASALHDRIVALTSHLPQLLSVALGARLAERLDQPDVAALCGPGLESMLRLAESPWPLWREILESNANAVAQEVRALAAILSEAADALDASDPRLLAARFDAAADAVARLRENAVTSRRVDDAGTL